MRTPARDLANPPYDATGVVHSTCALQVREHERKGKLDLVVEGAPISGRRRDRKLRLGEAAEFDAFPIEDPAIPNLAAERADCLERELFKGVRIRQRFLDHVCDRAMSPAPALVLCARTSSIVSARVTAT